MRRLKFRAWNESKNCYMKLYGYLGNTFWDDGELCPIQEYIILEHFTGLFDKNGIEICEGDMVKASLYFEGGLIHYSGSIVYSDKSCAFGIKNIDGIKLLCRHPIENIAVTGNIHGNNERID